MDNAGSMIKRQHMITVGDTTYTVHLFAPSKAIKLIAKLTKLVGEPFAVMAGQGQVGALNALPVAVKALAERLDEEEVVQLVQELFSCVTIGNQVLNFDHHFTGRMGSLMRVLKHIMEIQFEDFLTALSEMFQGEGEKPQT